MSTSERIKHLMTAHCGKAGVLREIECNPYLRAVDVDATTDPAEATCRTCKRVVAARERGDADAD